MLDLFENQTKVSDVQQVCCCCSNESENWKLEAATRDSKNNKIRADLQKRLMGICTSSMRKQGCLLVLGLTSVDL